ncbi:SNF2 family N-terminal domain [Rhizoctonia solani]|uniref:SNF2 family N-terminal domain n=1 Tax=Rhizoctonia solani TaxID=456999 RepID=A0A8H7I292_9AGAM|nr:SNF2 family N-terminal domain [Rhizoctonia solani]
MKRLHIVLKAIMLRRTKDMTINGAPLLNLPGRKVETLMCDFDEDERAFYEALEQKTELTLNKFIKAGTKDFQKDIDAVESKPAKKDDEEEDELADLFQKMGVDKRALTCTICQTELPADADDENRQVGVTSIEREDRKMVALLEEIDDRSNGEDKTIVFSQFTTMLDLLEPFLKDADISFTRLDGSMLPKDREVALDKIRNSSRTKVILISFKAGSTGLNLTACNNVILVDLWWNPALEDQAFDRAHRLGQTKDVHIYKLTIAHTVEERILKLQDAKRDLAKAALSGDKLNNNRLRLDDIMKLFNKHSHEDSDDE